MQIQKENVRINIIEAAREEFFDKGFKGASMRTISAKSKVKLGNIYNYFKNKDEILTEVLRPLLNALEKNMEDHNKPDYINTNVFTSREYQLENIHRYVQLILKYREELKLLFFNCYGSVYENFREEFSDRHTQIGVEYLRMMKEKYPEINIDISDFFIHNMSSWWLTIIGELVSHDLSPDQVERFIGEFLKFSTAGWKRIMNA